ncbi:family 65 glycosyl hydrolase [Dactylosporangium sp. NBC_01737]|uniref:glycoside hydrolase family 65 protein n=1 Tax=Dactylosporangium sp. NBC_01737 TaxID=2975959 RepID=UPI002E145A0A|nr:family 65 glycosyl hydrolase [Dactylosporangium sp. NBC_01737]
MNAWRLAYEGFDPAVEGLREALCTLGNGYMATRGAAPESTAGGVHYPGTYAAGCYNRLSNTVAGEIIENESLVNLPNWLPLTFRAGDGPWLGQAGVELLDQRLELDLRRGVLTRRLRVRDGAGRTTRVTQRRFVHMRHPHLCGLQTTLVPEDWSGTLRVRSVLDATVENSGVARYRGLAGRHFAPVCADPVGEDAVLLVVETNQSHVRIAQAARTRVMRGGRRVGVAREPVEEDGRVGHELGLEVRAGHAITIEKLVTTFTSRDATIADPAVEAVQQLGWVEDFDQLLAEHVLAWRQLWQRFRVSLRGRGERVLRVVRLHLFHLLQTVSEHSVDLDVGVPARGLHGEAYRGHVLWDELFVFPILNVRVPLLTRALLCYRYRRLPWARHAARVAGHIGAGYPWQSGSDGREETQHLHLNPMSGRWTSDPTHRQRHIGLAVAYNVWQYYQVTGDREFVTYYGAEMLLEIARFFADLAGYDHNRGRYVVPGVIGPDEFHTGYPEAPEQGVDNNAYTNVMTVWVMLRALEALSLLPDWRRAELTETLGLRPEELRRWEDISHRMYVPMHDEGIISQFEGYERLAEFDWEAYRARYADVRRLDRILESEGDSPNRYKVSKQADVLMLFYLLSADELGELFDRLGYRLEPDTIPRNIEYYLARTSHGSTLSAVVHAWLLARNHREQALEYFIQALDADVADIQGGTTPEGIHLAAMAGSVDVLQRCFGGVETRGDTLRLNPYWPPQLGTLEFDLRYREHPLTLRITGKGVRISAGAGMQRPIRLHCRDETALLSAGETVEFPVP